MCDSLLDMMKRKYMSVKKVYPDNSMDNVLICDETPMKLNINDNNDQTYCSAQITEKMAIELKKLKNMPICSTPPFNVHPYEGRVKYQFSVEINTLTHHNEQILLLMRMVMKTMNINKTITGEDILGYDSTIFKKYSEKLVENEEYLKSIDGIDLRVWDSFRNYMLNELKITGEFDIDYVNHMKSILKIFGININNDIKTAHNELFKFNLMDESLFDKKEMEKVLRWPVKALSLFGPCGCSADIVNMIVAMTKVCGKDDKETIILAATEFVKCYRDNANFPWIPTKLICDAEFDDNICYQILEKIHKIRGTKLNVIVQLPPSVIIMKYNEKIFIDYLTFEYGWNVIVDSDSSNSEKIIKHWKLTN